MKLPYIFFQDKFNQLLNLLPDLREMAQRGEDFLYFKHMQGHAPHHTLLMEMLLAKKKDDVSSILQFFHETLFDSSLFSVEAVMR